MSIVGGLTTIPLTISLLVGIKFQFNQPALCLAIANQRTVGPIVDSDNIFFFEDIFADAFRLYKTGEADSLDLATDKLKTVIAYDSTGCFFDASFYLVNIYLSRNETRRAREILAEGREQYAVSGDAACTRAIAEQFDNYLEHMSIDSLRGLSTLREYDEPPVPVGGFMEIYKNLVYPEDAIAMSRQGKVVVQVFIDCSGHPCRTPVTQSSGVASLDLAARTAVKLTAWKPAKRNGEVTRSTVSVPIVFQVE